MHKNLNNTKLGIIWQLNEITLKAFTGNEAKKYFQQIADLRITMFKNFPYLYEGSIEYEKEYLNTYFDSPNNIILLLFDKDKVVGFSNSIPLEEEMQEIKEPFIKNDLDIKKYLYIGEVMILPEYRIKNLFHKISDYHNQHAKLKRYSNIIFMTIIRPNNHPSQPKNYRSLDILWKSIGYKMLNNIKVNLSWKQVDTKQIEENKLSIWEKKI